MRSELQTGEEQHLTDNDLKSLSLTIYRQRRKRHPTLPKCIIDVHEALSTMTVKTSKSEDMCLVNDVDSHIIIFSWTSNLRVLCTQVKEIIIHGTFKCCLKFFWTVVYYTWVQQLSLHTTCLRFVNFEIRRSAMYFVRLLYIGKLHCAGFKVSSNIVVFITVTQRKAHN